MKRPQDPTAFILQDPLGKPRVCFLEVQFIMLFEYVTLSNRCYFWSLSNFILVKKNLWQKLKDCWLEEAVGIRGSSRASSVVP